MKSSQPPLALTVSPFSLVGRLPAISSYCTMQRGAMMVPVCCVHVCLITLMCVFVPLSNRSTVEWDTWRYVCLLVHRRGGVGFYWSTRLNVLATWTNSTGYSSLPHMELNFENFKLNCSCPMQCHFQLVVAQIVQVCTTFLVNCLLYCKKQLQNDPQFGQLLRIYVLTLSSRWCFYTT